MVVSSFVFCIRDYQVSILSIIIGFIMGIIEAKNVVYEYIRRDEEGNVEAVTEALSHVNLDVKQGQFIAILGHNGSGKSTLAKHINALLTPTAGDMYLDRMNTKEDEYTWKIRQKAGMIFQNPDNQIVGTIVEEDVGFGLENIGVPTEDIWKRVEEALDAVNMQAYREYSPNRLSGGQKQRVAIAGVLAMKPKCIILDESTAMLDPVGRKDIISAMKELNKKEKITVILITHYMDEAIETDKIYVMDKGKIKMEGTPREIFSQVDILRDLRLDVPIATSIAHDLRKKGLHLPVGILTRKELVEAICQLY